MTALEKWDFVEVHEYLASELESDEKHEFVDGVIHSMAGGRAVHHKITMNASGTLFGQLRGKPCRPYNSDQMIRVLQSHSTRFYYPDLSVFCHSIENDAQFADDPTLVLEVLSPSTKRIDLSEKKEAYLSVNSLNLYLIASSERYEVIVYRRGASGFEKSIFTGIEASVPLPEIEAELSLAELYQDVDFSADS